MELNLGPNIRRLRKARHLTQEQLAEALGVTVGAVSKWESGATSPELSLLVEVAAFFETSVDSLLGYRLERRGYLQTLEEMDRLMEQRRHREALALGRQALPRYPHSFELLYHCALCLLQLSSGFDRPEEARQAVDFLTEALELFHQNQDPSLSPWLLKNQLARAYFNCAEVQRALDLYKENNINGINDGVIAQFLADNLKRPDEALPYAQRAWSRVTQDLIGTAVAIAGIHVSKKEERQAMDCLEWLLQVLESLRPQEGYCETDIMCANLLQAMGEFYLEQMEDQTRSWELMEQALRLALAFDAIPKEQVRGSRFFEGRLPWSGSFYLGDSAMQILERRIQQFERTRPEVPQQWRELRCRLEKEQENHE